MADALTQNMALANSMAGIVDKLFGSKQFIDKTGGTTTEQTQFSQEGINALLKGLMEGTTGRPGLAAIAGGQRPFGLYNTTARTQLVNDFTTRSAAEVAKLSAPRVQTTTPSRQITKTPGAISPTAGLLGAGALVAASPKARGWIKDQLGFGEDGAGSLVTGAAIGDIPSLSDQLAMQSASSIADGGGAGFDIFGGALADSVGSLADAGVGFDTAYSMISGADQFIPLAEGALGVGMDTADTLISGAGIGDVFGGFPVLGVGSDLLQGDVGGAALTGVGYALGGPVGGLIGSFVGDIFGGDDGGCFITTACCKLYGKDDDCHELTMMRKFRDEFGAVKHPLEVVRYYDEAPKLVAAIEAREDADHIWRTVYTQFIKPCVVLAQEGAYEQCYEIYAGMVEFVKEVAHGNSH